MSFHARQVSSFWLGVGVSLTVLTFWAVHGVGDEMAIRAEVAVHGKDLAGQLAQPIAEMKQQLTNLGCHQLSVAYWSQDIPTQLHVEVRCRSWIGDGAGTRHATHESPDERPSR